MSSRLSGTAKTQAEAVAKAIMSEASVGTREEKIAVGFSCQRNKRHAQNQNPTQEIQNLADDIIEGKIADNSQGADHWYSPRSMPKEGEDTLNFDVKGGLEQVEGLSKRNFRPGWATKFTEIHISGVRPAYFKFYRSK